jgi:hypothetical protein
MPTLLEAMQEQNRLLVEQNRLLQNVALIETSNATGVEARGGMMTDYDLQLILMSDNPLKAIDRWNESRGHGRGRRVKVAPQKAP